MPPDDNLFDESGEEGGKPEKGAEKGSEGSEGGTSGDLSQMRELLEQAVSGGQATQEQVQQLTTALTAVAQRQQTQQQAAVPPSTPDERFRELYQDPDAYINKQVQAGVMAGLQKLGPHLKVQAEQMRDALLAEQRTQIDKDYGEGAWDSEFKEEFDKVMANLPLEMQSSREHVDSAISAIIGNMVRDPERREKLQERGAEVKKRREAPAPSMMSGHRPAPRGQSLNPTEKEFLASLARNGIELDAKEYVDARERGRSESDWAPAGKSS